MLCNKNIDNVVGLCFVFEETEDVSRFNEFSVIHRSFA